MYYIGIDPATKRTGIAVLNHSKELIYYQSLDLDSPAPKRYDELYEALVILFRTFPPEAVWIEDQYYQYNANTLKKIARMAGIAHFAVESFTTNSELVAPSKWRKVFHGKGNASKQQTFDAVNALYDNAFTDIKKENDITDAIGIAYACALNHDTGE